jgi:hypothetical protein
MALPNKTARLRPQDGELSRIQDNLAELLDAVLSFLNTVFSYNTKTKALTVSVPLAVTGGISQGSRFIGSKGFIGQSTLATNGTYLLMLFAPGSTTGFVNTAFVAPFSGSIAAFTAKVYGAAPTAGTIAIASAGCVKNATAPATLATTIATTSLLATYAPGAYPFGAGTQIDVQVTSAGWVQPAGVTGIEVTMWVYC